MKKFIAAVVALSITASAANGYVKMTGLKEAVRSWLDRSKVLSTSYVGEASDEVWGGAFTYDDIVKVRKDKDKDFVILNLTDTHFGDYDYRRFTALGVLFTAKQLVKKIKPDLITVSGDIVCTDSTVYSVKRFTDMMESFGVPWAPVFGNHDDEGNCDLNYLADIMLKSPHCILRKGPASMGVGNYVIGVTEEDGAGGEKLVEALVMMDSHHAACNAEQVEWFAWAAQGVNTLSGGSAEITTMMHIPLAQYQYGCDEKWDSAKKTWKSGSGAVGTYGEKICCARDADGNPVDNGLFAQIKKAGGKYVFCGHEHLNNFSFVYDGVRLTYMMKIGIASGSSALLNGGTKIVVGSDGILRFSDESILRTVLSVEKPLG